MAHGILFVALGAVLILLAALATIRVALLRVESPLGRWRDGLRSGTVAPGWQLADAGGVVRRVPNGRTGQVLIFADHAIVEFPSLVTGIQQLVRGAPELEILVITRADAEVTRSACQAAGVELPIIIVDDAFYKRHNVWVMPHVLFIGLTGTVLVAGNVAEASSLSNMWRHALLLAAAGTGSAR
jgi:hypothetical protein